MTKHYKDYVWREGIPYGIQPLENRESSSYKISMDPYRKRISIEKYEGLSFETILYDSILLDFRSLKDPHAAWEKTILEESKNAIKCLIRDQNDRVVYFEDYVLDRGFCRECRINSAHGIPLSLHRMFYQALDDSFDGVILYDASHRPVMYKAYEIDPATGEFGRLIEECWKVETLPNEKKELTM